MSSEGLLTTIQDESPTNQQPTNEQIELPNQPTTNQQPNRNINIDVFRGFIMIIMAWDHCKDILWNKPYKSNSQGWDGVQDNFNNNFIYFFVRIISHICAPGFFFTMGITITLFSLNRYDIKKWDSKKISLYYLKRGMILLLVGRLVDGPFIIGDITDIYLHHNITYNSRMGTNINKLWIYTFIGIFEVMTCLGLCMLISGIFIFKFFYNIRNYKYLEYIGFLCMFFIFICSNIIIVYYQNLADINETKPWPRDSIYIRNIGDFLLRIFFINGAFWDEKSHISYPVIPWIGITIYGISYGFLFYKNNNQKILNMKLKLNGILLLFFFFIIRSFGNSFGNLRGWSRKDHKLDGTNQLLEYFNMSKYPPSTSYCFFYLGINLIILSYAKRSLPNFLIIYGKVPLFFYILHFWFFGITSCIIRLLFNIQGFSSLFIIFIIWIFSLFLFYPLCIKYNQFKKDQISTSFWKFI